MGKRERPASGKKSKKRMKKDVASGSKSEEQEPPPTTEASSRATKRSNRVSKPIFLKKKIDIEVSLLPGSLRNAKAAVEDSIGQLLMKYSDGLGGILMSYENVRLNSDKGDRGQGWIFNELPWIHYTSSCDALVFRPYVGCKVGYFRFQCVPILLFYQADCDFVEYCKKIHGVVNECFPSHLGMLVLDYFNAMVSADELREAGYSFDAELQKWVFGSGAQAISVESRIEFEVEKIHECEGTLSLEGAKPSLVPLVETKD